MTNPIVSQRTTHISNNARIAERREITSPRVQQAGPDSTGVTGGSMQSAGGQLASELGQDMFQKTPTQMSVKSLRLVTGSRYGDTFVGERWNQNTRPIKLGHGADQADPSLTLGGKRDGWTSGPLEDVGKAVKSLVDKKFGGDADKAFGAYDRGNDGLDAGEVAKLLGDAGYNYFAANGLALTIVKTVDGNVDGTKDGKVTKDELRKALDSGKKTPRDEGECSGGGWMPLPGGTGGRRGQIKDAVRGPGGDDSNDGRGNPEDKGGVASRADRKRVDTKGSAADGRVRVPESATVAYARAMVANQFTDPKRG